MQDRSPISSMRQGGDLLELSIDEQKDLLNALKKVQNICNRYRQHCSSCPLSRYSETIGKHICVINTHYPFIWKLNKPDEEWRAFL